MESPLKETLDREFSEFVETLGFNPDEVRSAVVWLRRDHEPVLRIEKVVDVPSLKRAITFMEEYQSVRKVV